jgi:hypothetical protein
MPPERLQWSVERAIRLAGPAESSGFEYIDEPDEREAVSTE